MGGGGDERGQRELFQQDIAIFKYIHRVGGVYTYVHNSKGGVGYKPIIKPTSVFS